VIREAFTRSEIETENLAVEMAAGFEGGEVVLLSGELGTGKTVFVRGIARGLGIAAGDIASPTFVLLTSHRGRLMLHHADLYRLRGDGDDEELGLEELPGPRGVLAVEWAERISRPAWDDPLQVLIEHAGGEGRRLTIEGGVK
jgi:tRNA threonylcarbamoyladenosine biosynthesis protein TsaE